MHIPSLTTPFTPHIFSTHNAVNTTRLTNSHKPTIKPMSFYDEPCAPSSSMLQRLQNHAHWKHIPRLERECAEKRLISFPSAWFFLVLCREQELAAILTLAAPCSVRQELQRTLEGYTSCAQFHNQLIKDIGVTSTVQNIPQITQIQHLNNYQTVP